MKRSIIIILAVLVAAITQGCQKYIFDTDSALTSGSATLQIGIVTRSASTRVERDGVLGEAEYAIKTLRIFAFESDGSLDKMDFVDYSKPIVGSVYRTFLVTKAPTKTLYVIVNEPVGLFTNIDDITSPEQLDDMNFTIAEVMNNGFNAADDFSSDEFLVPMTAVSEIVATENTDITIGVDRAVARVDFMLDKNSDATDKTVKLTSETVFQVNGVTLSSKLMAGGELTMPAAADIAPAFATISSEVELPLESADNSTAVRVLSFYLAERAYSKDDQDSKITIKIDRLKVDSKSIDIDNTITLGDITSSSELSQIKRNYIYKIYATYIGVKEEVVADQFAIVDWNYEELDGDIEGVTMSIQNTIAMDWLRNGNSFTAPAAAFGSNKPVSVYLPVSTGDSDGDGLVDYQFKLYEFPAIEAGASYELTTLELENSFIYQLNWIDNATLVFTSDRTGYVEVTYSTISTSYDLQTYPIRFKSDNVIKEMKIIYDNGYIPPRLLPEQWEERAPGGIVFAKRGDAQHPSEVEDIFFRDDDGYYRGDFAAPHADIDEYCKTLGDLWYVPSAEDMEAMIPGVKELGTSYRFQDTGSAYGGDPTPALYWTSTESTTPGSYYCGNFIYNKEPIDNVMDWIEVRSGTESNFVRCVLDIK